MFVVKDLRNLLPLSFDNSDLMKLSKDIDSMKSQMFVLQSNQNDMIELLLPQDSISASTTDASINPPPLPVSSVSGWIPDPQSGYGNETSVTSSDIHIGQDIISEETEDLEYGTHE